MSRFRMDAAGLGLGRRWSRWRDLLAQLAALGLSLACLLQPAAAIAAESTATMEPPAPSGAQLFSAHCAGCHVNGGNVIRRGRTLKLAALERAGLAEPAAIARVAAAGIGQMSGYGTVLGEDGTTRVAEWVWLQAQAGWPRSPQPEPPV